MDTPSLNGPNSLDEIDLFTPIMADLDTPTKKCFFILDKKVRNLEKKKGKLDLYQLKLKEGEDLLTEQKEALTKYDATAMNLEFARDIQNQLQIIFDQMEFFEREKERIEKLNRMQTDLNRIREVLHIKMVISLVHNFRHIFQNGVMNSKILSKDELLALEKFYIQIALPSTNNCRLDAQIDQASTHMLYLLTRSANCFDGHVTYASLRDAIDRIERLGLVERAAQKVGSNFVKNTPDKNGVKKLEYCGVSQVAVATISATLCASTTHVATSVLDTTTVSVIISPSGTKDSSCWETKGSSCLIVASVDDKCDNKEVSNLDNLDSFPPIVEKSRPVAVIASSNEILLQDSDPVNIDPINEQNADQVIDPICQLEAPVAVVPHCDVMRHAPVQPVIYGNQSTYGYVMNPAYQTLAYSDMPAGGVLLPIQSAYPLHGPMYTLPYASTSHLITPDAYLTQPIVGTSSTPKTDTPLQAVAKKKKVPTATLR